VPCDCVLTAFSLLVLTLRPAYQFLFYKWQKKNVFSRSSNVCFGRPPTACKGHRYQVFPQKNKALRAVAQPQHRLVMYFFFIQRFCLFLKIRPVCE